MPVAMTGLKLVAINRADDAPFHTLETRPKIPCTRATARAVRQPTP